MHPRSHLLLTTLVAVAVQRRRRAAALPFWIGGALADADHLLWHVQRTGRLAPRAAWQHFAGEGAADQPDGALLFHRWPVILAGLALARLWPWAGALAAGLAFHRSLDALAERFGPRRYSPSIVRRQELHRALFERAGWRCESCGVAGGPSGVKLEAHHRIPREAGGQDALENLVALCVPCHRAAHAAGDGSRREAH